MNFIERNPIWSMVLFAATLILAMIVVWVTKSHFEAQAYNNVTGKNVSTWDAMWIELRVQEGTQD